MLINLFGDSLAPTNVLISIPLGLILLYLAYQLFSARRKRYLPLTITSIVLTILQVISYVAFTVGATPVGGLFQSLAFSCTLVFIILLTQVQWKQNIYEKIISFVLSILHGTTIVLNLQITSNVIVILLTGFLMNQIKNNVKSASKSMALLLILTIYALSAIIALSINSPIFWTISNLIHPILIIAIFITLQERLMKMLMNSYIASVTDPLTGLYNKRQYQRQLQTEMNLLSKDLYAIFCDIDNFKKLNDTQGHKKGDEMLIKVAHITQEEVSSYGIAARYGGEEIVAFVNLESHKVDIDFITERIRERVQSETIVTLSIGYAKSDSSLTCDQLIHMADKAMYYSKTNGKNSVSAFNDSMD
ncbi:GGDEF domain-containing protein [Paenibacillus periandrae]|uniref:GGDEF domain-containing protein n=1 Tax=Paenibacillus periandrae TaxID=1761741 RepID=UPI001F092046|nr:GGDEF domain-containing protein [Paenibacillus periandrae]